MTAAASLWALTIGLPIVAVVVIGVIVFADVRYPRDDIPIEYPAPPLPDRAEKPAWIPAVRLHDAPTMPLTLPQAHRDMQLHRSCVLKDCPRKGVAHRTLVAAGRIRPRS